MRRQHPRALITRPTPPPAAILIPIVLILAILVIDLLTPPSIHLAPLLVAAPAITGAFAGPRVTAAIAAMAVGTQIFLDWDSLSQPNRMAQLAGMITVSAVVVAFTALRDRRSAELSQVRFISNAAQQILICPPPTQIGTLELSCGYRAATDQASVGGDFYAAIPTAGGARFLIGDVRGKGMEALEHAALVLGAFRTLAHRNPSLTSLAEYMDGALAWNSVSAAEDTSEDFATALVIEVSEDKHQATMLNCGHCPPLLLHNGTVTAWEAPEATLPLGLGLMTATHEATTQTFPFAPGDTLLLYTDGVIEARNAEGIFYPLADRLAAHPGDILPAPLIARILKDLKAYTASDLKDDVALLAVHRLSEPAPRRGRHPLPSHARDSA
ncbi:PP2C family protein-serine/threonine phosphatase [Peterkaempfera sp. SMS 1(5)a]|uniref:PP2C family protein-serine/threonine phosphatase n=1 Tax=Peterkaempfera podocarpi TaxID=3232308 RepID=UPI00367317B8